MVEDDKIGTDFLEEKITEFEDYVSTKLCLHLYAVCFYPFTVFLRVLVRSTNNIRFFFFLNILLWLLLPVHLFPFFFPFLCLESYAFLCVQVLKKQTNKQTNKHGSDGDKEKVISSRLTRSSQFLTLFKQRRGRTSIFRPDSSTGGALHRLSHRSRFKSRLGIKFSSLLSLVLK